MILANPHFQYHSRRGCKAMVVKKCPILAQPMPAFKRSLAINAIIVLILAMTLVVHAQGVIARERCLEFH